MTNSDYSGVSICDIVEIPKSYPTCEASEKEVREARVQVFILRIKNDEDLWTGEPLSDEEKVLKDENITCPSKTNEGGPGSKHYDLYSPKRGFQ